MDKLTPLQRKLHDAICTSDRHGEDYCLLDGVMMTWIINLQDIVAQERVEAVNEYAAKVVPAPLAGSDLRQQIFQVAFNTNGQDFYPATYKELEALIARQVIAELASISDWSYHLPEEKLIERLYERIAVWKTKV